MTPSRATPNLSLTLGRCDDMRAEVFLRITSGDAAAAISGTLAGPHRGRDTTLPVTARLEPTATAGVARVILTEPAYWTPDLPNVYRLRATVAAPDAPPHAIDRLVGLRRLGIRGRSLWLDGRRWVPRAVRVDGTADITACKPAALAALITEPEEATLTRADEIGVAVLGLVTASATDDPAAIADRIAAWSAHPAVVLVILPGDMPAATGADVAQAVRGRKGTLLLAAAVAGTAPPPTVMPPGIDAIVVTLDGAATPHDAWRSGASVPLLARRRGETSPAAGRLPCDTLQATLASWGAAGDRDTLAWDWAGYVAS